VRHAVEAERFTTQESWRTESRGAEWKQEMPGTERRVGQGMKILTAGIGVSSQLTDDGGLSHVEYEI
jgi:hypothetical protein